MTPRKCVENFLEVLRVREQLLEDAAAYLKPYGVTVEPLPPFVFGEDLATGEPFDPAELEHYSELAHWPEVELFLGAVKSRFAAIDAKREELELAAYRASEPIGSA